MPDYLGDEVRRLRTVEAGAMRLAVGAGYREARLPILEHTDVFEKPLGPTSDVVNKEMYTFQPPGSDDRLTLRPEGTAGELESAPTGLMRALIARGMTGPGPAQKWFYCGPMFRHERPQKGRLRQMRPRLHGAHQFQQFGLELVGTAHWAADVEVILLGAVLLESLGLLPHVQLRLNTIGDAACRREHRTALLAHLEHHRASLSQDSLQRIDRGSPLRVLDSKDPRDQAAAASAPRLVDYLSSGGRTRFERVQEALRALAVPFVLDPTLVRGLDYYGETVFEFVSVGAHLGAHATVLAGGRYDDLVAVMGGKPTPAVGWAAGVDRLALMIDDPLDVAASASTTAPVAVAVVDQGLAPIHTAMRVAAALLRRGVGPVLLPLDADASDPTRLADLAKQLRHAARSGAAHAIVIGPDELAAEAVQIKTMATGQSERIDLATLLSGADGDRWRHAR